MCAIVFSSIQHSLCCEEIDFQGSKWGDLVAVIMAYLAENNPKRQQNWFEGVKCSILGLLTNSSYIQSNTMTITFIVIGQGRKFSIKFVTENTYFFAFWHYKSVN